MVLYGQKVYNPEVDRRAHGVSFDWDDHNTAHLLARHRIKPRRSKRILVLVFTMRDEEFLSRRR
jgi:hypothetical protein